MRREAALQRVRLAARGLDAYTEATAHELLDEVRELAAGLRDLRLVQVNSTASGGGVAELLQSVVPLELGLGLDVDRVREAGWETVGEIVDFENMFLLCYVRGPEGLIVELVERLDGAPG